jgi:hypothetical protein
MSYAGWEYALPTLTLDKLRPFLLMVVMIATGKLDTDIPEMGILLLSIMGSSNIPDTYSSWKDKFVDFLGSYCSCYTGASLQYLVRKDDDPEQEEMETFASTNPFLVNTMSYESSVNLAFSDENQALASCLAKALGLATKETSDLLALTSKGFGRLAWVKLHDCIMGSAKATHARVATLEQKLKHPYTGGKNGSGTIQTHNSVFITTVQQLATAGCVLDKDCQVRDYLWSIQDPALVALKDAIWHKSADLPLVAIQQQFVDVIEG